MLKKLVSCLVKIRVKSKCDKNDCNATDTLTTMTISNPTASYKLQCTK